MKQPKELTLEKLKDWQYYLTVGELRKALSEYPDDAKVLVQRVEDQYYDGVDISGLGGCTDTEDGTFPQGSKSDGWPVVLKKADFYHYCLGWNKQMDDEVEERAKGEIGQWPFENPEKQKYTQEQLDAALDQYSPAFCVVKYKDDPNNLYLDLHY